MRKVLFFLLITISFNSFSQDNGIPRNEKGFYEYTDVVSVDSVSAEKLYSNAKIFIARTFKSGKEVTQLDDDISNTVIGKGNYSIFLKGILQAPMKKYVNFNLQIQCKDGRYKYTFDKFSLSLLAQAVDVEFPLEEEKKVFRYIVKKQHALLLDIFKERMKETISQLEAFMKSENSSTKDW